MTAIQLKYGPFATDVAHMRWPGTDFVLTCDVVDRIKLVKHRSGDPGRDVQSTVRLAAERRLRWVNKAIAGLKAQVAS